MKKAIDKNKEIPGRVPPQGLDESCLPKPSSEKIPRKMIVVENNGQFNILWGRKSDHETIYKEGAEDYCKIYLKKDTKDFIKFFDTLLRRVGINIQIMFSNTSGLELNGASIEGKGILSHVLREIFTSLEKQGKF